MRIIGLMSGTSADGIDSCLARIDEAGGRLRVDLEAFLSMEYPPGVRRRVLNVRTVDDVCRLNFELGELFARAALDVCADAGADPSEVDAIGSHGQTVRHVAEGRVRSTLQIGEPCVIAQRTGITTVADFRPRDIAAGGCGAPLVPVVDFLLLADAKIDRAALNIGGIANVTLLPAACSVDDVIAFDTGPGNIVLDGLMGLLTSGRVNCDRNGAKAGSGDVSEELLAELLADEYYLMPAPKSPGREKFGRAFAEDLLVAAQSHDLDDADIMATATALTARSIAGAIDGSSLGRERELEVVASGGGVHNSTLMQMLRHALPRARVLRSDELGLPADAKEAVAFAVLAFLTLQGRPGNVTGATGASERVVLGKIVPGHPKKVTGGRQIP